MQLLNFFYGFLWVFEYICWSEVYDKFVMSIIKGDSLLSNLSNISVLIKPGHNSSIFNLPVMQSGYEQESVKMYEVKIQDIFP